MNSHCGGLPAYQTEGGLWTAAFVKVATGRFLPRGLLRRKSPDPAFPAYQSNFRANWIVRGSWRSPVITPKQPDDTDVHASPNWVWFQAL